MSRIPTQREQDTIDYNKVLICLRQDAGSSVARLAETTELSPARVELMLQWAEASKLARRDDQGLWLRTY